MINRSQAMLSLRLSLLTLVVVGVAVMSSWLTVSVMHGKAANNQQTAQLVVQSKHAPVQSIPQPIAARLQALAARLNSAASSAQTAPVAAQQTTQVAPRDDGTYVNGASTKYLFPLPVSTYTGPSTPPPVTSCPGDEVPNGYSCMAPYLAP